MLLQGWDLLLSNLPNFRGKGRFPVPAYSEFMPPPRLAWRPAGVYHTGPRIPGDRFHWMISEHDRIAEVEPGLQHIARRVLHAMQRLDRNLSDQGITPGKLRGNPYWLPELATPSSGPRHERYVVILPLALSKTQDDKARVRWTLFGGSEQGPDRAFWKSFYSAPGKEKPVEEGVEFIRRILRGAYGVSEARLRDLRRAGFRILPGSGEAVHKRWKQDRLPRWTRPYLLDEADPLDGVRFVLTFRPFSLLSPAVQKAYLAGQLHLIPFPGSLIFWGARTYLELEDSLPLAMQVPLLNVFERHEDPHGIRIPQSGWLHVHRSGVPDPDRLAHKVRNTYRRTHRWERLQRHQDELSMQGIEDHMARALFGVDPDDIGLYSKPMARNAQIWTDRYDLLLDGPRAGRREIRQAEERVSAGGMFGYRLYNPPMQVGNHEVFWHLPLVAYIEPGSRRPRVLPDGPAGYLTAYDAGRPDLSSPVELWPLQQRRPELAAAARGYRKEYGHRDHLTALNVTKIIEAADFLEEPVLARDFVTALMTLSRQEDLDSWLRGLAAWRVPARYGRFLYEEVTHRIAPAPDAGNQPFPAPITYGWTANRRFEETYWKTIARLSEGRFRNKDNADCIDDPPSLALLRHFRRDLEALGTWLLAYYRNLITQQGMRSRALAGELPFRWRTDFNFPWMGGWRSNQAGKAKERNLLVVIPGKDRSRAVVLADHYDTAYREDLYYKERGGTLARLAAAGADDNHSATAALMLGAPVFMELSRSGRLGCDIWLLHLTGEEFPADSLGARHLGQELVERSLKLHLARGRTVDLSGVRIEGIYVMDMIAHNRRSGRDIFQISPGLSRQSYWLAYQAHLATLAWNAGAALWNRTPERRHAGRGKRSRDGVTIPPVARHLPLRGEVRIPRDPRSSLFNTDGQIFSDAGIPVVLFMENYDIDRVGYHDSFDTMANIDLDYGAALAAIAIESTARVAAHGAASHRGSPFFG